MSMCCRAERGGLVGGGLRVVGDGGRGDAGGHVKVTVIDGGAGGEWARWQSMLWPLPKLQSNEPATIESSTRRLFEQVG